MSKKVWLWLRLFLIISLFLTACSAQGSDERREPLRVEWTAWDGDYTLLIAQEKGLFEKHGVEVEPVYYETFSQSIPDMSANRIDAGLFGFSDTLTAARVADVRLVGVSDSGGTVAVVSTQEIQTAADLRGKTVAAVPGTYGDMFMREVLNSGGLTVKDVVVVDIDPDHVPEALTNGTISAGYVWSPLHLVAVEQGHKILYSQAADSQSPDVIVFRADVVNERPEDVRAFMNAWFEAVEYRLAHPQECDEIIAKITGFKLEDVAMSPDLRIYNREENLAVFDKNNTSEFSLYVVAQKSLEFRIRRGDITTLPDLNVILDPSFLQ